VLPEDLHEAKYKAFCVHFCLSATNGFPFCVAVVQFQCDTNHRGGPMIGLTLKLCKNDSVQL
jgi:hypothetical protein